MVKSIISEFIFEKLIKDDEYEVKEYSQVQAKMKLGRKV